MYTVCHSTGQLISLKENIIPREVKFLQSDYICLIDRFANLMEALLCASKGFRCLLQSWKLLKLKQYLPIKIYNYFLLIIYYDINVHFNLFVYKCYREPDGVACTHNFFLSKWRQY